MGNQSQCISFWTPHRILFFSFFFSFIFHSIPHLYFLYFVLFFLNCFIWFQCIYTVSFRYASGQNSVRVLQVDGNVVNAKLAFPSTGGYPSPLSPYFSCSLPLISFPASTPNLQARSNSVYNMPANLGTHSLPLPLSSPPSLCPSLSLSLLCTLWYRPSIWHLWLCVLREAHCSHWVSHHHPPLREQPRFNWMYLLISYLNTFFI